MNLPRHPRITPVGCEVNARTVWHGHPEWGREGGRATAGEWTRGTQRGRSVRLRRRIRCVVSRSRSRARARLSSDHRSTIPRFVYNTVLFTPIACYRYCGFFFLFFVGQQQSTPPLQHPAVRFRPVERSENACAPLIIWTEYTAESDRPQTENNNTTTASFIMWIYATFILYTGYVTRGWNDSKKFWILYPGCFSIIPQWVNKWTTHTKVHSGWSRTKSFRCVQI